MNVKNFEKAKIFLKQIEFLENLKKSMYFKKSNKFVKAKNLIGFIEFWNYNLKNEKNADFADSLNFIENQWTKMLNSYIKEIEKKMEKL